MLKFDASINFYGVKARGQRGKLEKRGEGCMKRHGMARLKNAKNNPENNLVLKGNVMRHNFSSMMSSYVKIIKEA